MPYKDLETRKEYNKRFHKEWYQKNKDRVNSYFREYDKKRKLTTTQLLREYKKTLQCEDCDFLFNEYPEVCEFHHLDPSTKNRSVNGMRNLVRSYGWKKLLEEIKKCIPLCARCHRIRTVKESQRPASA